MGEQVGQDVGWAAVEDPVVPTLAERFERAFELQFEVFEGRHLGELMAFLREEVVGLVDRHVAWEQTMQLLDERRLPGSMRS
jgi:hypothetical protein